MILNSSKTFIKDLAEFIALEYKDKITPLETILQSENINLFYGDYGDTFDGMTIYEKYKFYVHINTDRHNHKDSSRARFTIAHELGHYFIENHRIGLVKGYLKPHQSKNNENSYSKIEREADYFASCLLMPEERIKKDVFRKKFDYSLIEYISKEYNVSKTAAAIRLADIGNHPIKIVFSKDNRIKWVWESEDFPYKYLLNGYNVPENTVMGEYFTLNRHPNETEEVWAIDWFNYVKDYHTSRKFKEHCIVYKNSALSIIWE